MSALIFAPIVVGSPVMQWAGFVMSGLAQSNAKGNHSIEACAVLDKLEQADG